MNVRTNKEVNFGFRRISCCQDRVPILSALGRAAGHGPSAPEVQTLTHIQDHVRLWNMAPMTRSGPQVPLGGRLDQRGVISSIRAPCTE